MRSLLRRALPFVAVGLLLAARPITAQRAPSVSRDSATVLFICEHGTVKSLLAKLLFEHYATEVGLPIRALSRGTAVDSTVPPWMLSALGQDQFTLGSWQPAALRSDDLASAALVVSFDVPRSASDGAKGLRAQWDGLPSVSRNYPEGRDAIRAKVRRLVDSLQASRATRRVP